MIFHAAYILEQRVLFTAVLQSTITCVLSLSPLMVIGPSGVDESIFFRDAFSLLSEYMKCYLRYHPHQDHLRW